MKVGGATIHILVYSINIIGMIVSAFWMNKIFYESNENFRNYDFQAPIKRLPLSVQPSLIFHYLYIYP